MEAKTQCHFQSCVRRRERSNARNDNKLEWDLFANHFIKIQAEGYLQCRRIRLFYQALPEKSLHYKGERCSGGEHRKVRLNGLAAGYATGEKLPLFVIGKSAKPHCFSGVKSLPCCYRSQKIELDGWGVVY